MTEPMSGDGKTNSSKGLSRGGLIAIASAGAVIALILVIAAGSGSSNKAVSTSSQATTTEASYVMPAGVDPSAAELEGAVMNDPTIQRSNGSTGGVNMMNSVQSCNTTPVNPKVSGWPELDLATVRFYLCTMVSAYRPNEPYDVCVAWNVSTNRANEVQSNELKVDEYRTDYWCYAPGG